MFKVAIEYLIHVNKDGTIYAEVEGEKRVMPCITCSDKDGLSMDIDRVWQLSDSDREIKEPVSDLFGSELYVARRAQSWKPDAEAKREFSILSEKGVELFTVYAKDVEEAWKEVIECHLRYDLASYISRHLDVLEHVPMKTFLKEPKLGEYILDAFRTQQIYKLEQLRPGQDCSEIVEETKREVARMNKIFNNVEKNRAAIENLDELCERDTTI